MSAGSDRSNTSGGFVFMEDMPDGMFGLSRRLKLMPYGYPLKYAGMKALIIHNGHQAFGHSA
jgi:hypothetical protein